MEYRDLAPTNNIQNGQEYINALQWALENPKIKNIALAGPYGSGKSSIIDTYIERQRQECKEKDKKCHCKKRKTLDEDKYYKISMATFTNAQNSQNPNSKIEIKEDEVEKGILKQLFYKVEHKKIPQSRYRKLNVKKFLPIFFKTLFLIALTAVLIAIFKLENILCFAEKIAETSLIWHVLLTVLILIALICIAYLISYLWYTSEPKYHLKEIKLPGDVKVENTGAISESAFNKNLDEIMYFFEVTKVRVVFFEDLDRLPDREIFVHLRELNNLLNNDDAIKNKPIVFVYAVRDDIFTKEDRTKFFDFIIPVIPIVNATNSGEILLERLQESESNGISHEISQEFVLDVSPYISDMRMLQNIYNEFIVYKNTLRTSQALSLSDEQMLAMMIFKNICPSDFADIQEEKGIIKDAFEAKAKFIKEKKEKLQSKIDELSSNITKVEEDCLKNTKELKAAMLMGITDNQGIAYRIIGSYQQDITADQIIEDSFDLHELDKDGFNETAYVNFSGESSRMNLYGFKDKIAPYLARWEYLYVFEKESKETIQTEIANATKMQHTLTGKSVKELLTDYDDFRFDKEIADNKLLIFMLRRGYIDEKYANYINYFKGNSITTADMNYILSVKNREPKPFDYALTKSEMVIRRLQEYEFEQKAIYNFDLMEQLLSNDNEKIKLNLFIQLLSDGSELSWKFINEFVDRTKYKEKFIILLATEWTAAWSYIAKLPTLQYERQLYYLKLFFDTLDEDIIIKLNENKSIKTYIENHPDILQKLGNGVSEKILCELLTKLDVSFKSLEISGVPNGIVNFVFDNCLYELNEQMIFTIVLYKNEAMLSSLNKRPYTTIIDLGYKPLIDYVHNNFTEYIEKNVLAKESPEDREELIIRSLERIFFNEDLCIKLIQHEQFQTKDISLFFQEEIEEEDDRTTVNAIWDTMLMNEKTEPVWENIMSYWKHFSLSNVLCEYIGAHTSELTRANTDCCSDAFMKDFINAGYEDKVYKKLLPILKIDEFDIPIADLTESLLDLMVDINYFKFTAAQYEDINEEFHNIAIKYVINNQEDFISQVDEIEMSTELLNELLRNNLINQDTKETLFDLFAEAFMAEDIVYYIIENQIELSKACFELAWKYAEQKQKEQLLFNNIKLLNNDDLEKYFSDLDIQYQEFSDRSRQHQVRLPVTEDSLKLAKHLEKTGYITSYKVVTAKSGTLIKGVDKEIKYRIRRKTE